MARRIGNINIDDDTSLFVAFQKAAEIGVPVMVHAEDLTILEARRKEMEREGRNDTEAYLAAHSPEAEVQSIRRIIQLTQKICHIHF